jgi:hypothetical protein
LEGGLIFEHFRMSEELKDVRANESSLRLNIRFNQKDGMETAFTSIKRTRAGCHDKRRGTTGDDLGSEQQL